MALKGGGYEPSTKLASAGHQLQLKSFLEALDLLMHKAPDHLKLRTGNVTKVRCRFQLPW